MPVATLLTSAASFLYAVSSMLNGAQNNAAVQQSFLSNFQSSPTHFLPVAGRGRSLQNFTVANANTLDAIQIPASASSTNSVFSLRSTSGKELTGPLEISYHDGETIATLITDDYGNVTRCELLEVNKPSEQQEALERLASQNKIIEKTNFNTMLNIIRACQALDGEDSNGINPQADQPVVNPIEAIVQRKANMWTIVSGILPGTKWCGLKDIADGWNDLGPEKDLDKCCRSHDLCPRKVLAFRAAYGLVNWSFYTKSHCECDAALYDCLKRASTQNPTAELLGNFYFNVLRVQCIDEENPPRCLERNGVACTKWEDDDTRSHSRLVFREVRQMFR